MFRVTVGNFQSIVKSTLEVKGFTVVTGPNNSGKSAVMRAVRGVFTNARGTSFVRNGTDACEVTVEFEDGNAVTWEKGKSTNRYTVNGKVLDKVGAGVPDEVAALGIYPIQAGSQTVWPQIAPQFTGQVFLLDQPGSVLAEALADVERVGKLSRALKAADSDKRQAQSELKVRRADAKALVMEMAAFDGLDTVLVRVSEIEATQARLHSQQSTLESYGEIKGRLDALRDKVAELAPAGRIVVAAQPTQAVADCKEIADLTALRNRLKQAQVEHARWDGSQHVRVPVAPAVDAHKAVQDLLAIRTKWNTARTALARLEGFVAPVTDSARAEKLAKACGILKDLHTRVREAQRDIDRTAEDLRAAQRDLALAGEEVRTLLEQMPSCPTCGQGHKDCT